MAFSHDKRGKEAQEERDGKRDSLGKDAERRSRVSELEREARRKANLLDPIFTQTFSLLPNPRDIQRLLELL